MRNIMATATLFAAATISFALLCVTVGSKITNVVHSVEMMILTVMFMVSFVHFAICCRVTHHITFFIALYPDDVSLPPLAGSVREEDEDRRLNRIKTRQLASLCNRHMNMGKRMLFIAFPTVFIVVNPVALPVSLTFAAAAGWYMDDLLGMPASVREIVKQHAPALRSPRLRPTREPPAAPSTGEGVAIERKDR